MQIGFRLAGCFHRKVREGLRGRSRVLPEIRRWRENHKGGLIIIHSASAGEFEASVPLIEQLKNRGILTVSTVFSPSGYHRAVKTAVSDLILYLPADSRKEINRFYDILLPDLLAISKHDFWPNLIWEAERRKIPTLLINGNLPEKSSRMNGILQGFYRVTLSSLTHIYAVNRSHAERFKKLLPASRNISSFGDTRFDRVVSIAKNSEIPLPLQFRQGPVFIAGSVWLQELFVLEVFLDFKREHPEWKLIWVPHEPSENHIETVSLKLHTAGFPPVKFSEIEPDSDNEVLIMDKVGFLPPLYRYAELAFVGGGFGKGVHSVIEPAAFGIPVFFGPNYQVSAEASALVECGGGYGVKNRREFEEVFNRHALVQKTRKEAGRKALQLVNQRTGVTELLMNEIKKYILPV